MEFGCFVIFANEVIHELPCQLKGGFRFELVTVIDLGQ